MNNRLQNIFDLIPKCTSFADVGCDHGYIAKAVIENEKCQNVFITDISESSLAKAERLLKRYITAQKVTAICCDGLQKVPRCETVLIAGMGGEEIIKILSQAAYKPENLVLQPMKNTDKLRRHLIANGYAIKRDFIFKDGERKFYNALYAKYGEPFETYSEIEYEFGRENLVNRRQDFIDYLKQQLQSAEKYEKKVVSLCDVSYFNKKIALLKEVINGN